MPEELVGLWYTTAEAAQELGVSHDAIHHAVRRSALSVRKVAPRLNMISAVELARYRAENLGRVGRPRGTQPQEAAVPADHLGSGEATE